MMLRTGHPGRGVPTDIPVGNAVLGVPQVLCTCIPHQIAAFGGWNAGDGAPYENTNTKTAPRREPGGFGIT